MHFSKTPGISRGAVGKLVSGAFLIFVWPIGPASFAQEKVDFSIVERVRFTVAGNWKVISSKADAAITVFAFQIPNEADEGTSDSTNLAFIASYLKDSAAKSAFEKKAAARDPDAQERKLVDNWSCSSFSGKQGSTIYEVWDCYRIVAECGVHVRIAWPHLPKNPPNYDKSMESALEDFLKSVALIPKVPPASSRQSHL